MPLTENIKQTRRNLFKKETTFLPREIKDYKANRAEEILNTTITYKGNIYEIDEVSMDRFDRVIDLANWKYNQTVASGVPPSDAYQYIYLNNTVIWKTYDNQFVEINIESICELQELALNNLQKIWG